MKNRALDLACAALRGGREFGEIMRNLPDLLAECDKLDGFGREVVAEGAKDLPRPPPKIMEVAKIDPTDPLRLEKPVMRRCQEGECRELFSAGSISHVYCNSHGGKNRAGTTRV